jgi:hypothetical protein
MEIYGTTELPIRETQNPPSPKFLYYFHLHFPAVCVCSILLFNLAFSSMLLFNLKRVQSCCSCSILFFATNSCSILFNLVQSLFNLVVVVQSLLLLLLLFNLVVVVVVVQSCFLPQTPVRPLAGRPSRDLLADLGVVGRPSRDLLADLGVVDLGVAGRPYC